MNGTPVGKHDVAKGAGVVALSRLGAIVEVIAQPAYVWMFGVAIYGVYTVLWAAVNTMSNFVDLAMRTALQRIIPQAKTEVEVHSALKIALLVGVLPSILIAVVIFTFAPSLAELVNAGPAETAKMEMAVRIFAPALPLWTFIEVTTSAVRARRAFGPEVRLRLFWEQFARLITAFGLFLAGWSALALVTAHIISLAITAALAMRLLGRYYDLRLLWRVPLDRTIAKALITSGLGLFPSGIVHRFFIDLPPLVLNVLIPGNGGAVAAGLFGIARKIATIPQLVQQVFMYVLAPLASAQAAIDRAAIAPLYAFATRLSTVVVIPLAMLIVVLGDQILHIFTPEAVSALPILVVLIGGRAVEAIVGPASPVLEMIGHKLLPTVNSLIGLGVWAIISYWRIPIDGAVGMAFAVAAGVATRALLAIVELRISDGFRPFQGHFPISFSVGSLGAIALILMHAILSETSQFAQNTGLIALAIATIWMGLRFGLTASDRRALGRTGTALRLTPATPLS